MKVMRLQGTGGAPLFLEHDAPRPRPGRGEVLVRVRAVGVTPSEMLWYPTTHNKDGSRRLLAVPGHEFSGEIAELGEGSAGLACEDDVYGMNDWFAEGALAEYCLTRPEWIARKPKRLSHEEAACVPISALTAWQGLLTHARLQRGERVLVHGGAGAVGSFATQIARSHAAYVVATASRVDAEFVKELGANDVIDYRTGSFENQLRDLDVVFDTVGGDTLERSWQVLRPGGRMVTVAASSEALTVDERVKKAFFIVEPDAMQLREIGRLLDLRALRSYVSAVVPLSAATEAYGTTTVRRGHGKTAISMSQRQKQTLGQTRE